ncbi:DNA ligase 3 [Xylocopa sonorina]|uniref:DNA ligase 3 n=1 Tax=Xylocopa sonorina TaxID=1818115 RepID=UPI00403ACE1B
MSDEEKPFAVERAKTGRAKCKKCKCPIEKDTVRIAKLMANPFSEGKMKAWHHLSCLFEVFAKQRATTKRIDDPEEDISGWEDLCAEDKTVVLQKIEEFENSSPFKAKAGTNDPNTSKKRKLAPKKDADLPASKKSKKKEARDTSSEVKRDSKKNDSMSSNDDVSSSASDSRSPEKPRVPSRDDAFEEFHRLCCEVAKVDAYTDKTAIVRRMFTKGSQGDGFKSDVKLWCRMLLPGTVKRVYNLQSKQLVKLFSRILLQDEESMLEHLEKGDVAETIRTFHRKSAVLKPAASSVLTIHQVDEFLERLSSLTKEDEQIQHFRSILPRCTLDDLKMIIRLIKHDLRINAGPKHILGAVHDDAYEAFQTSRDLDSVLERCLQGSTKIEKPTTFLPGPSTNIKATISLMTPVLPMLAEACKSVEMAMQKCPNGMQAEVKYDGERVQVHKKGNEFRYFSRSLKPVLPHKVNLFKDYISEAFPDGDDLILDSEVLMIDTKTGQPLPFGSLGLHKKAEFKDANVCLFVFDCLYYNGTVLLHKTMAERRKILRERMTEIPNRIMLSEVQEIYTAKDLAEMIAKVLKLGLEGLVLKDMHSKYEPGKRHWLKVKKDYLCDGAMADSADLVVLGAWYGTGNKGGMMSVFLMGCYDEDQGKWVTVTKVHTGHDDETLARLQLELDMVKISKDPGKLPSWLRANKPMIPDFVAKDPKKQPVWEITGAEFTNQGFHTADGISIRFPRVTCIREDKDWSTATTLKELRRLFAQRNDSIDFSVLLSSSSGQTADEDSPSKAVAKKTSKSPSKRSSVSKASKTPSPRKIHSVAKLKVDDAQCSVSKDIDDQKSYNGDETKDLEQEDQKQAEFYAFVNDHYIEYSASGTPLNWIEGRKPSNGLPADAKPLVHLTDSELQSRSILKGASVGVARGFTKRTRRRVSRLLKTYPFNRKEFEDAPKSARHVTMSWLDATSASSKIEPAEEHAVQMAADYCSCPHDHS